MNNLNEVFGLPNFDISEEIMAKNDIVSICLMVEGVSHPRMLIKYKEKEQETIDDITEMFYFINKLKNKLPTQSENPDGLHGRYIVEKVNGEPIDDDAEYFILRLDKNGSDPKHIAACRKAVMTYAEEIKEHLPKLSADLIERYGEKQ